MLIACPHCDKTVEKRTSAVNRARKIGASVYCSRLCSGLARRKWKSEAQKKAEKAEYDQFYRSLNYRKRKQQKAVYHKLTYDPIKAAEVRRERMPQHVEYCRQPKYKKYKREYDRQHRAREYGEFADAYLLVMDIDREVNTRMSDYDVRVANGTLNKRLQRKRAYAALISGRT